MEPKEEENTSTMRYEEAPRGRRQGPHICCQKISVHHPLGGERETQRRNDTEREAGEWW